MANRQCIALQCTLDSSKFGLEHLLQNSPTRYSMPGVRIYWNWSNKWGIWTVLVLELLFEAAKLIKAGWWLSLHEANMTFSQLPALHVVREAGSSFINQLWKEFWMPHAFKIPKYTNCSNTPLIWPIPMDSDSRHSITILYIPWGKIWSTCSNPNTEEPSVQWEPR